MPQMAKKPENASEFEAALLARRKAVFESAVLIHLNSALTLARYLTRHGDVAEDLVQEALLRAYRSFDETRSSNVRAWLLTIVRNCFLTWKVRNRDASAHRDFGGTGASLEQDGGEAQDNETPESILIRHEEDCTMRSLIEGLPHPFREVLVLRDIEDMSYREIADIAGVPMGTVMSRLARARKLFAETWKGSQMRSPKEMLR
jgi:RNA polymerase sigma-70 factor (ECF subfamily)